MFSSSVVCCLLSVVCCLLFVVCCLLFGVWCLVFGVCCLLFVVCCLLFGVWVWCLGLVFGSGVWVWCVFYFGTRCPVPEAPRRVATGFSLWSKFMLSAIFTLEQVTILEIDAVPI